MRINWRWWVVVVLLSLISCGEVPSVVRGCELGESFVGNCKL